MATRAKYTRVRQEDKKEDKPDTDILMRFSPTYGTSFILFRSLCLQSSYIILWGRKIIRYYQGC